MAKFKYPELPEFPEIPEPLIIPEVPQIPMPEIPSMPESVIEVAELAQASFVNSGLIETLQQINGEFLAGAVNIIQAVSDAVQNYWSSTLSELADTAGRLIEAVANFKLPTLTDEEAEQLVESNRTWGQYGWTYIPSMPMSMYDTPPADIKEANKVAIQYCTVAEMEKVFDELGKWKLNHRDLESAIFCYKNKQYKACALLLCGMIESKLIRQQSDAKRPVGAGAVARLKENYDGSGEKILDNYTDPRGYEWMLEDGEFKILLIGNSFSEDASNAGMPNSQMLDILQAMLGEDVSVTVGLCYSGGKGLNWHATQSEQGNKSYSLRVIGTETGKWKSYGSYTSANALTFTDWDVVSLQYYEINTATGKEGNAYPDQVDPKFDDLKSATEFMLDYVDGYAPQTATYFYMHWARAYKPNLNESLATYNKMAAFFPVVMDYSGPETNRRFETIIPVGLAVQNARTTYLSTLAYNITAYADKNLNLNTDAQIGLQRDTGHLSYNIGRYLAALTFAEFVIPEALRAEGYVLPEIRVTESIGKLPSEYSVIVQKAVRAAVDSWGNGSLAVTNVGGYTLDPTVAASKMLENMELSLSLNDADNWDKQIRAMVLAALPDDFAVDNIAVNAEEKIATVTIRFGYTSATVEMAFAAVGPVITQQPTDVTANLGEKFKITVEAEGEGLTYQWYYSNNGGKSFAVSSFKTNTYAMTMANYCHNRQVYCIITDANGNSVQTDTVTITAPLTITKQPVGVQTEIGQKFSISVEALGDGLTYQ